jgi:hypothetical protein
MAWKDESSENVLLNFQIQSDIYHHTNQLCAHHVATSFTNISLPLELGTMYLTLWKFQIWHPIASYCQQLLG